MNKRMTETEFKEALTLAGVDIDGYEGILNVLSMFYDHEAERYFSCGLEAIGLDRKEIASKLYGTLCTIGYYKH